MHPALLVVIEPLSYEFDCQLLSYAFYFFLIGKHNSYTNVELNLCPHPPPLFYIGRGCLLVQKPLASPIHSLFYLHFPDLK